MININELIKDYTEQKKIFSSQLKNLFFEFISEFFKEVPEITVIKWAQFTPWYNDGEECIFRVNLPIISNGSPEYVSSYGEYKRIC